MANKKWVRRPEARRPEILSAALKAFSDNGFAETRLEDVAADAGVSKALIYLYFEDKEEVLRAVIRETLEMRLESGSIWLGYDLASAVRTLWQLAREDWFLDLSRLALEEGTRRRPLGAAYARTIEERILRPLEVLIGRGRESGELRDVAPGETARTVYYLVVSRELWRRSEPAATPGTSSKAAIVEFVLHALNEPPRLPQADGF